MAGESEVSKSPAKNAAASEREQGKKGQGIHKMDISLFYAVAQCSLKMEAKHHMQRDFELRDPAARRIWDTYEKLAMRNLGKNEKWVPWHTVLGVHELFLVKEVHGAKVPWWTDYNRFVAMFLFRCHCKMDLFQEVQMPLLSTKEFWKDLTASFAEDSRMEKSIAEFRRRTGKALQTACFLIIPERILPDDDANLIRNIVLRSQRLIGLADELWPLVNNKQKSVEQKYGEIKQAILKVRNLGDTWVKMLMVCIDICLPHLGLLKSCCEVGVGAADPLRKLLVDEGLLDSPPPRRAKVDTGLEAGSEEVQVALSLRGGTAAVKRKHAQLIQVTKGMAGSLDRAHAIAEELKKLAIKEFLHPKDQEKLKARRQQLFDDPSFKVPRLGLDAKQEELIAMGPAALRRQEGPTPRDALMALGKRINESEVASASHFWTLLADVESNARKHFKEFPLIIAQMRTKERMISAVTLQVQLCEFRQFESFMTRDTGKRPASALEDDARGGKAPVFEKPAAARRVGVVSLDD